MTDPLTPALLSAAANLPAATKSRTFRNILKVLGLWVAPVLTRRALDDLRDINSQAAIREGLDQAAAQLVSSDPEAVARYAARYTSDAIIKQTNIEAIAKHALEELSKAEADGAQSDADNSGDAEQPDIDDGWRMFFSGFGENISDPEMQLLWGRLLAGEIKQPGSFSRRTLRTLADMDHTTAQMFADFSKHLIVDSFVFTGMDWNRGPKFLLAQRMFNWGLISASVNQTERQLPKTTGNFFAFAGKNVTLVIRTLHPPEYLSFHILALTEIGKELLKLCEPVNDKNNVQELAAHLRSQFAPGISYGFIVDANAPPPLSTMSQFLWGAADATNIDAAFVTT